MTRTPTTATATKAPGASGPAPNGVPSTAPSASLETGAPLGAAQRARARTRAGLLLVAALVGAPRLLRALRRRLRPPWPRAAGLAHRASEAILRTLERDLIFSGVLVALSGALTKAIAVGVASLRAQVVRLLFTDFQFTAESGEYVRFLLAFLEDRTGGHHSLLVRPMQPDDDWAAARLGVGDLERLATARLAGWRGDGVMPAVPDKLAPIFSPGALGGAAGSTFEATIWFQGCPVRVLASSAVRDDGACRRGGREPVGVDITVRVGGFGGAAGRQRARETMLAMLELGRARLEGKLKALTEVFVRNNNDTQWDRSHGGVWSLRPYYKPSRPLSSIILKDGDLERIVADVRRYLSGEQWYRSRGIPYHRTYVFYGVPGCGKTSLVSALAGEFRLPIYILDLSRADLTGEFLERAFRETEQRSIILFEDVDAAFLSKRQILQQQREAQQSALTAMSRRKERIEHGDVTVVKIRVSQKQGGGKGRSSLLEVAPKVDGLKQLKQLILREWGASSDFVLRLWLDGEELGQEEEAGDDAVLADYGLREGSEVAVYMSKAAKERAALKSTKLSFSSLLQILDGIKSPEGRVVILTTNVIEVLEQDEALCRPGRLDFRLEFAHASRSQLRRLFLHFYGVEGGSDADGGVGVVATPAPSRPKLRRCAEDFLARLPGDEALASAGITTAKAQSYFMRFRDEPQAAAAEVALLLEGHVAPLPCTRDALVTPLLRVPSAPAEREEPDGASGPRAAPLQRASSGPSEGGPPGQKASAVALPRAASVPTGGE